LSIAELILKEGYTSFEVDHGHNYHSSGNNIKNLKAVETFVVAKIAPKPCNTDFGQQF